VPQWLWLNCRKVGSYPIFKEHDKITYRVIVNCFLMNTQFLTRIKAYRFFLTFTTCIFYKNNFIRMGGSFLLKIKNKLRTNLRRRFGEVVN